MDALKRPSLIKLGYTKKEAAVMASLSVPTLERAITAAGDLACCKVGVRVVFTEQQLMDWLKSKEFKLKPKK